MDFPPGVFQPATKPLGYGAASRRVTSYPCSTKWDVAPKPAQPAPKQQLFSVLTFCC